jgi:hypothetical protein
MTDDEKFLRSWKTAPVHHAEGIEDMLKENLNAIRQPVGRVADPVLDAQVRDVIDLGRKLEEDGKAAVRGLPDHDERVPRRVRASEK